MVSGNFFEFANMNREFNNHTRYESFKPKGQRVCVLHLAFTARVNFIIVCDA